LYSRLREPEYREAWERGHDRVKISIRRTQLQVALGTPDKKDPDDENKIIEKGKEPNTTMLIWLGKQLLGQSEKVTLGDKTNRTLDPGALDQESVTIPWDSTMEDELRDIDNLID
jgi:hypothetical protein